MFSNFFKFFKNRCRQDDACDDVDSPRAAPQPNEKKYIFRSSERPACGSSGCVYSLAKPDDQVVKVFNITMVDKERITLQQNIEDCNEELRNNNMIRDALQDSIKLIALTDLVEPEAVEECQLGDKKDGFSTNTTIGFPYLIKKKCVSLTSISNSHILKKFLTINNIYNMILLLKTVHDKRIYLLDIKPDNMVVCNESLCFTDFGGARTLLQVLDPTVFLNQTKGYISPEMCKLKYSKDYTIQPHGYIDNLISPLFKLFKKNKSIYIDNQFNTQYTLLHNYLNYSSTEIKNITWKWVHNTCQKNDLFAFALTLAYIRDSLVRPIPKYIDTYLLPIIYYILFNCDTLADTYTKQHRINLTKYTVPDDIITSEKVLNFIIKVTNNPNPITISRYTVRSHPRQTGRNPGQTGYPELTGHPRQTGRNPGRTGYPRQTGRNPGRTGYPRQTGYPELTGHPELTDR